MTPSEHLLVCLAEESSEVVKAVAKALRFGLHVKYDGYADGKTNVEAIRHELHDPMAVIEMVNDEVWDVLPFDRALIEQKKSKVCRFMGHARVNGSIQ